MSAQSACIDQCPESCPATYLGLGLVVSGSGDTGAVNGVAVTVAGPVDGTMSCEPNQGAIECSWPSGPVTPGTYSLEVTAPGFQAVTVSAIVTLDPGSCGCVGATLEPSDVTLDPLQ